jgi:hypothetical protein
LDETVLQARYEFYSWFESESMSDSMD